MESERTKKRPFRISQIIIRIVICLLILMIGLVIMKQLTSLKKPPVEAKRPEPQLQVEAVQVQTETIQVTLSGYGEVRALNTVSIAPEISGRAVYVHPRLETGEIIPQGATLFKIDSRVYEASLNEANAALEQMNNTVLMLEKQYSLDKQRYKTITRIRDLAQREFKRLQQLYDANNVGTQSGVDKAEQAYHAAVDQADQMARALALYPLQIQEVKSGIEAAKARATVAEVNLSRCRVSAPFNGRIKSVSVEIGQFLSPGQPVVTLADDARLEIQVSLDSREARQWLLLENTSSNGTATAWFNKPSPVTCHVRWTENPEAAPWNGTLDRVVQFTPQTRMVTVAIRIDAASQPDTVKNAFPLVEGMFCHVEIPGKTIRDIVRLPRWSVTFDNTVYVASEENRLKTIPVKILRSQGEDVLVSEGLNPGQTVVITRLSDPLENSLLDLTLR